MAKNKLSAVYGNSSMADVTRQSLGLAFPEEEKAEEKALEPETVNEEASVIKSQERKAAEPTQKQAAKTELKERTHSGNGREKRLTQRVSLIMDPILFERLKRASDETDRSINNYVALAIKRQLDKDGY